MKGFFHIIFLILFIVSCSDKTNNYIDDNDSNDSDSDALTPACEGEWEKRIIQTNKDKFFDFEIVMKKEKWNWFAENNIESISIKEESNIEVRDLYVSNAGDIYFLIDDYEKNRENFLNIYRKNGEIERYYIKSDFSTGMINAAAQIKIRKSQAQKMIFDELNNKLYVLLAFPDKNKDPLDGETKFKPVIAEFISSEEWTFSVLDFTGNTICQNFIKEEEFFFLNCEYYFSIEKFSSSGMYDDKATSFL